MGNTCKKRKLKTQENLLYVTNYSKNQTENYNEYFKLIKEKLRRFYIENQNNQFNISLSLDKKDFNSVITSKKISINPAQKFVYWKDFLINYLNKQVNKRTIWANELMELINGEMFLSENKWLSLFFWQEFEMKTKPKGFSSIQKIEDNSIGTYNTDSMFCITDKFNGSLVSLKTDALSVNDPAHEYKEYRTKVKTYINIFKEHIFNTDHPINTVNKLFHKIFCSYLKEKLEELNSMRNSNSPDLNKTATILCRDITKSLQKFILKLQTALRLMYSKTINYQCFIEEKDEFINLVTNLVFREGSLYNDIYQLLKISLNDQILVLATKFNMLKDLRPDDLGIHDKFCLNNTTLDYQQKLLKLKKFSSNELIKTEHTQIVETMSNADESIRKFHDKMVPSQSNSEIVVEFSSSSNSHLNSNTKESITFNDNNLISGEPEIRLEINSVKLNEIKINSDLNVQSTKNSTEEGPYSQAVKSLRSICRYKVPFEKLILIATISSGITDCINNYWKNLEKIMTSSLLNIDADELMTIFIYIIIKSNMAELLIHAKFIKEFTTSTTRSTMMGYYFTTLEASLIYILSINDKSDLLKRDQVRQSLIPNKSSFIRNENEEDYTLLTINSKMD